MRKPVAVIQKGPGSVFVFCDDGSVWEFYHKTEAQYDWVEIAEPLPGSEAAQAAELIADGTVPEP